MKRKADAKYMADVFWIVFSMHGKLKRMVKRNGPTIERRTRNLIRHNLTFAQSIKSLQEEKAKIIFTDFVKAYTSRRNS